MAAAGPAPLEPPRRPIVVDPSWDKQAAHRAYIREFFVDVLGSLIPGLIFSVTAGLLVSGAAFFFWRSVGDLFGQQLVTNFLSWLEPLRFEMLTLVIVASYVVGNLFYRQDPKEPDRKSANRMSEEDRKKGAVRGWPNADVQFPYLFLYEYLDDRGLKHLARLVPWRGSDPATHTYRTKMFINQLKIRLQFEVPDKCGDIVRNEAHVRMMSSVWYVAAALERVAQVAGLLTAIGVAISVFHHRRLPWIDIVGALPWTEVVTLLSISGGLYYMAAKTQWTIERFFHYQRVREVVYALETAYFAHEQGSRIFLTAGGVPGVFGSNDQE